MCGIFGSFNFKRFEKLYNENKQRGNFAVGTMYVSKMKDASPGLAKDTYKRKREGVVDLSSHYSFHKDYDQFLGLDQKNQVLWPPLGRHTPHHSIAVTSASNQLARPSSCDPAQEGTRQRH